MKSIFSNRAPLSYLRKPFAMAVFVLALLTLSTFLFDSEKQAAATPQCPGESVDDQHFTIDGGVENAFADRDTRRPNGDTDYNVVSTVDIRYSTCRLANGNFEMRNVTAQHRYWGSDRLGVKQISANGTSTYQAPGSWVGNALYLKKIDYSADGLRNDYIVLEGRACSKGWTNFLASFALSAVSVPQPWMAVRLGVKVVASSLPAEKTKCSDPKKVQIPFQITERGAISVDQGRWPHSSVDVKAPEFITGDFLVRVKYKFWVYQHTDGRDLGKPEARGLTGTRLVTTPNRTDGVAWVVHGGRTQWIDPACRGELSRALIPIETYEWDRLKATGHHQFSDYLPCQELSVKLKPYTGVGLFAAAGATNGHGWVHASGWRQWVSADCRNRIEYSGVALQTVDFNRYILSPDNTRQYRSCRELEIELKKSRGPHGLFN